MSFINLLVTFSKLLSEPNGWSAFISSIILGVNSSGDITFLKKLGFKIVPYFLFTTAFAVLIGIAVTIINIDQQKQYELLVLKQNEMLKDYPEFLEKMGLKPMSSRFANTTGNLVDIASIPVTPEMQGNNPEFVKRIFEARMELDRMGRDRSGNPQGQPQGIPSISGIPSLPLPGPKPPDSYPIFGPRPPFMPGPDPFPLPGPGRPPYGDKFEGPRPYNYFAQSPQYMPQYRFRGVPSLNTDEFNEELRKRFGVA